MIRSLTLTLFFFNDTATTEIYTLSLHDALPILRGQEPVARDRAVRGGRGHVFGREPAGHFRRCGARSEEHTSELQSRRDLVCRLLLEKKKIQIREPNEEMVYKQVCKCTC